MMPGVGSKRLRRNEAEWTDFWLTDLELDKLVKSVFEDYASQRESAFFLHVSPQGFVPTALTPFFVCPNDTQLSPE